MVMLMRKLLVRLESQFAPYFLLLYYLPKKALHHPNVQSHAPKHKRIPQTFRLKVRFTLIYLLQKSHKNPSQFPNKSNRKPQHFPINFPGQWRKAKNFRNNYFFACIFGVKKTSQN